MTGTNDKKVVITDADGASVVLTFGQAVGIAKDILKSTKEK